MRHKLPILASLIILFLASPCTYAKKKHPDWLKAVLNAPISEEEKEFDAVVLHESYTLDYTNPGTVVETHRYAIKMLNQNMNGRANAKVYFHKKSDKVTNFYAWLIHEKRDNESFDKKDAIIVAENTDSLYSELNSLSLSLSNTIRFGTIFAYETTLVSKTIFTQEKLYVHDTIPQKQFSVTILAPKNWEAVFTPVNNPEGSIIQSGNSYTWIAKNPKPYAEEDNQLHVADFVGYLGTNIFPTSDEYKKKGFKTFKTWADVANFADNQISTQAITNDAIRKKSLELTKNATTSWEKIQAIANYTQTINYVMISEGVTFGGGMKPFDSPTVFKRHYGDCKDMSTLTKAMLKSVGINSYGVLANGGVRGAIIKEWPSPAQFNHCIIAIEVDETIDQPAVSDTTQFGRLLYFDPTQQYLPVGEIPSNIANSLVLIASSKVTEPNRLPSNNPELNKTTRTIDINLTAAGTIDGTINENCIGTGGISDRYIFQHNSETEYKKELYDWLAVNLRKLEIDDFTVNDNFDQSTFDLSVDFYSPSYAKSMRGKMLFFKPIIVARTEWHPSSEEERLTPFKIYKKNFNETIRVTIPHNFSVKEVAKNVNISSEFGNYSFTIEEEEGTLVIHRSAQIETQNVALEKYPEVLKFYKAIVKAENTPILLVKK